MKLKLESHEAYLLEKCLVQLLYWDWIIQPDGVKAIRSLLRKIREYNDGCAKRRRSTKG